MLPFALDPNTAPGPSPLNRPTSKFADRALGPGQTVANENKTSRDYFNRPSGDHREMLKENGSRSASTERRRPTSPHIAYQEKGVRGRTWQNLLLLTARVASMPHPHPLQRQSLSSYRMCLRTKRLKQSAKIPSLKILLSRNTARRITTCQRG
jgi:hypothetical protein